MATKADITTVTASPPGIRPRLSADDLLARVVEASPTALVLAGHGGKIVMANRQAEDLFGYKRPETNGMSLELLFPRRIRQQHVDLRRGFLSDMSLRIMGDGGDIFGLRKDGLEFPMEIGLNPLDFDGEAMVLVSFTDTTVRLKLEREREQRQLELERSNADLEEFAYAASHDMKAPLRAISHLVHWIGEDVGLATNPDTVEHLRLLQGRTTRLMTLLDGLLAYSRVGRTLSEAERANAAEDVDVAELVREVAVMLEPPAGFTIAYEGTPVTIRTTRMSIRVVLENLIGNALKHHDGDAGRITVSARRVGGATEVRVTDDGPGIEKRFHERIFIIFQTLASRDNVEASGIGLAIVQKKVQFHGGRIWIESDPPARGATFAFTWQEATQ